MKDFSCLNTIITDDLAIHIDLTSNNSWIPSISTFNPISLSKWIQAKSDNITLADFGLTGFDNGRVNTLNSAITLTPNDTLFKLYRVGFNNATGGTFYTNYSLVGVTGNSVGNHFQLTGGFLQGFFKLEDYEFEVLPPRYGKGITIETLIHVTANTFTNNGFFFLIGARAEDKYTPYYSGESVIHNTNGIFTFSGKTTTLGSYLNNYLPYQKLMNAISDQNMFETAYEENLDKGINNNVIGFYISTDKKIGYKRINNTGLVESNISESILSTGWKIITIVFIPYDKESDRDVLKCMESRKGDLIVYVNGRQFWKVKDFDEFYFNGFKTQKEKQLGVPYNISWGGGSFGLKHSYHFKGAGIVQDSRKANQLIQSTFSNSFLGKIQKLRIYDNGLNSQEVLHNASIEAKKLAYGITISKGGRIISQ